MRQDIASAVETLRPEGLSYRPWPVRRPATKRISKQRETMCQHGVDLRPGDAGKRSHDECPQRPEQSPLLLHRQTHDLFLHWNPPVERSAGAPCEMLRRNEVKI